MISKLRGYRKEERLNAKKLMPPLLVKLIIIFTISFIFFAKALANPDHKETSIPVWSMVSGMDQDVRVETEENVINQLEVIVPFLKLQENRRSKEALFDLLLKNLRDQVIGMSDEKLELLYKRVMDIQMIIKQEKSVEIQNMSIEGRRLIFYIINEIFELSGYQITINLDGKIEKISDSSGELVYSYTQSDLSGVQGKGLVIVLSIIFLALLVCILIAKKNQLFRKDVIYDGLNEKQYA